MAPAGGRERDARGRAGRERAHARGSPPLPSCPPLSHHRQLTGKKGRIKLKETKMHLSLPRQRRSGPAVPARSGARPPPAPSGAVGTEVAPSVCDQRSGGPASDPGCFGERHADKT